LRLDSAVDANGIVAYRAQKEAAESPFGAVCLLHELPAEHFVGKESLDQVLRLLVAEAHRPQIAVDRLPVVPAQLGQDALPLGVGQHPGPLGGREVPSCTPERRMVVPFCHLSKSAPQTTCMPRVAVSSATQAWSHISPDGRSLEAIAWHFEIFSHTHGEISPGFA